ncbi:MAG: MFS transporter [Candidatus Marinimicrobia bacterium]|nr:MFS transporter [Candidatus Neomarinimicrobiota bacterium]
MKRNYLIVVFIFLIFYVISFLTNILGPLIPDIIDGFHLSHLALAAFLPFAFFAAYGVMSIPAGFLVDKYSAKTIMIAAFILALIGSFLFAAFPAFWVAMISLFLIGVGMAMLQVAINPLLRAAGGEEHFAFNSVAAQLVFGLASFISPQVYSYLVQHLRNYDGDGNILIRILVRIVPQDLPWISLYWVFVAVTLIMVIVLIVIRLPKIELKVDERVESLRTTANLFGQKVVILYFFGIFAYVGTEQGLANWMSKYLAIYHGFDPLLLGADAVSSFWGLLTAGCLLGLILLKFFDSRKVLIWFSSAAIISLTVSLFGTAKMASIGLPATGFFLSVMWSIIFSLALNSIDKYHGSFSGILCTGIVGGAFVPLIVGGLGDLFGLKAGMMFLYVTLGYILSIGFWAKPLITNKTVSLRKEN